MKQFLEAIINIDDLEYSDTVKKAVNDVIKIAKNFDFLKFIKKIYLVGSQARGEAKQTSDADLIIVYDKKSEQGRITIADVFQKVINKKKLNISIGAGTSLEAASGGIPHKRKSILVYKK